MSALSQFFLNPAFFLPGTALVLLPILIHILSRLRYRRVRFAAMEFLLESEELNRRRLILEQLLQLLLRILAVLLIVLLISRLLIDPGRLLMLRGASAHHVVLLDDSLSMKDRDGDDPVFQKALTTLETMLVEGSRQAGASRVTILPMTNPGRPIVSDRILDGAFVQEFVPRLRNLPCSFRAATPIAGLTAAKDILAADGSVSPQVHVLTDFRASDWNNRPEVTSALEALRTIGAGIDLIRVNEDSRPNVGIVQLTSETLATAQGVPWRMTLRVRNYGQSRVSGLRGTVYLDGSSLPGKVLIPDIDPGSELDVSHDLTLETEGRHQVEVRLEDDALREDNRRILVLEVTERRSVLILDDDGRQEDAGFVAAALSADPALTGLTADIRASQSLTADELNKYDCVYLLNIRDLPADVVLLLVEYVRGGGGIAWFPGDQASVPWYSDTLRAPETRLFPVPLGTIRQAAPEVASESTDAMPFANPVFEQHPIFLVYNAPDSPFPDTVQIARWFQVAGDWNPDDAERADGVRTLMRLSTGEPVAFEHTLGKGRILTFLVGAGRQWSNWPVAPAAPGYVVMHLLLHQYLQKAVDGIELRELTEPLRLQWPATQYTDTVEVYLPDAGPGEEPVADTFARLQASPIAPDRATPGKSKAAQDLAEPPNSPGGTTAEVQLGVTVQQAERPGVYRIRRFRSEGAVADLSIAMNVPVTESALTLAAAEPFAQSPELSHVRILTADAATALGGASAGRELRWVLLGLLVVVLIAEQLISLRLSFHPEVIR